MESGQERSAISKADDDKTTLSFNIPPDALKNLLKNYPDIKQQYEDSSSLNASSPALPVENATNPTDSQMAAAAGGVGGNSGKTESATVAPSPNLPQVENSPLPQTQPTTTKPNNQPSSLNLNELSKLLSTPDKPATGITSSPSLTSSHRADNQGQQQSPASTETTPKLDNTGGGATMASNNQTSVSVDKAALLNTIQNLLQNNVSVFEQNKPSQANHQTLASGTRNDAADSAIVTPQQQQQDNTPSHLNNDPGHQNTTSSLSSLFPQEMISSLKEQPNNKNNNATSPINSSPSSLSQQPTNQQVTEKTPSVTSTPTASDVQQGNPDTNIIDQASKLSKDDLLGVLKEALANKQNANGVNTASNVPTNQSFDYLNLPKPGTEASITKPEQQSVAESSNNHEPLSPATSQLLQQKLSNEDITSGLKKLLGMNDNKINTTTLSEDGSKFTKLVETCVRSSDDPKCMHGKITSESGYVPKSKNGIDESKNTISISPSALMQKLMERKTAEDSTPDAVSNQVQSMGTTDPNHPTNQQLQSPQISNSYLKPSLDPKTLMSLLQNAVASQRKSNTATTRQDVTNSSSITNNNTTTTTKTMCNNKLRKRGFSISYDCNNALSNYTHVGLTGATPVSTSDLLKSLLKNSGGESSGSRSLPASHLQKTTNGFQVDFDLHVKDQIPNNKVVSGTLKTLANGRQQHINLYNTPNGVVMKPKSSVQLLKPQFVPVAQDRDNIELRKSQKKPL